VRTLVARRIPDLHIAAVDVHTLAISHRNQRTGPVSEVLTFTGHLVPAGRATCADGGDNPAGA
jgi:hypothetical protein